MAKATIERRVYEGPGKVITARITTADGQTQLYPNVLMGVSGFWLLVEYFGNNNEQMAIGESLVDVFRTATKALTTNKLKRFFFFYGLTLQDVFNDNPHDTRVFIERICNQLTTVSRHKDDVSPHTLSNLKEFADSLNSEQSRKLKMALEDTIRRLEALPQKPQAESAAIALEVLASGTSDDEENPSDTKKNP